VVVVVVVVEEEEEEEEKARGETTPRSAEECVAVDIVIVAQSTQTAMAAAVDDGIGVEELRTEIERLSRELDLASTEKIQSAQYGLALLEEKSALQQRCNDLEALYENTKHELEITQEVSAAEIFRHPSSVRSPIRSTRSIKRASRLNGERKRARKFILSLQRFFVRI